MVVDVESCVLITSNVPTWIEPVLFSPMLIVPEVTSEIFVDPIKRVSPERYKVLNGDSKLPKFIPDVDGIKGPEI